MKVNLATIDFLFLFIYFLFLDAGMQIPKGSGHLFCRETAEVIETRNSLILFECSNNCIFKALPAGTHSENRSLSSIFRKYLYFFSVSCRRIQALIFILYIC